MTAAYSYPPGGLPHEDAARYVGCKERKLAELVSQGKITPRDGGGARVYIREELDEYLKSLPEWTTKRAEAS